MIFTLLGFIAALQTAPVSAPHAFDYQFGTWKVHVSRLTDPGSASARWAQYDGTHVVTPLLDGKANIGILEISGAAGKFEGLQMRAYDPSTQEWKLSFASGSDGIVQPPSIGRFENGQGDFVDTSRIGGRKASVRTVVTRLTETTYRDVISYSTDGSTWHSMWIADYTKAPDAGPTQDAASSDGAHDWDFQVGTWLVNFKVLFHRLAGSHDWHTYNGTVTIQRFWNGRGNVGGLDVHNDTSRIQTILLRTYNPQTRQWSDYSVNMDDGSIPTPAVGRFNDGRGELYLADTYQGRSITARYLFDDITAQSNRFVQSFSTDNGKTWEDNAVVVFTRTGTP